MTEPSSITQYRIEPREDLVACEAPSAEAVLIAKGDQIFLAALRAAVSLLVPRAAIDCVSRVEDARRQTTLRRYDLIVTGMMLLDGDALDWIADVLESPSPVRVMVVTGKRETRMVAALHELRAHGVFDSAESGPEAFHDALRLVLSGGMFWSGSIRNVLRSAKHGGAELLRQLTAMEQLVFSVIGDGSDDHQAAARLGMSAGAIRSHRKRLYAKLDVTHRGELIQLAMLHGFVRVSGERVVQPGLRLLMARAPRRGRSQSPFEEDDEPADAPDSGHPRGR